MSDSDEIRHGSDRFRSDLQVGSLDLGSGEIKDEVIYKINNETLSCKFTPDEKMFLLKLTMKDCSEDIRICLNDYLSKDKDKKKYVLLEIKYSKNFLTFFRTFVQFKILFDRLNNDIDLAIKKLNERIAQTQGYNPQGSYPPQTGGYPASDQQSYVHNPYSQSTSASGMGYIPSQSGGYPRACQLVT